ncbi:MAG: FAD-dependent oxidoreductase [Burkholderiaceae bacterium]
MGQETDGRSRAGLSTREHDVVVLGGGAAGLAAAIAAARSGARTLLVEAGSIVGGELLTGMAVDGALNGRGEWIVGGVARELFDECRQLGGYVGPLCDWRLIWYVCVDPEVMKLAVFRLLARHGVDLLLHTFVTGVSVSDGRVSELQAVNKRGALRLRAPVFIDCSGDGDLALMAGAAVLPEESAHPGLQPVSMMFRMAGVDTTPLLDFVRQHPEHCALGESEAIRGGRTDQQCADEIHRQGQPTVFFKADGPLLGDAIRRGDMYPTALIMIQPTSPNRREVCLNTTRVGGVDATDTGSLSAAMGQLMEQVWTCTRFMQHHVPGFGDAHFSGVANRVGVRETRRIACDGVLTERDVRHGRKRDDGIGKGSHHIDIHQSGLGQIRIPVEDGGSYDIPWSCLLPTGLRNVLIAGRCVSADRPAHGSVRVMGPCLAMGQASGTAAAWMSARRIGDTRGVDVAQLREQLRRDGAILDGTR